MASKRALRESSQYPFHCFEAVHKPESRLEDVFAGDFVNAVSLHCGNVAPAWPRSYFVALNRAAAPGGKDYLWIGAADLLGSNNTLRSRLVVSQGCKYINTSGALKQLADPCDPADQRFVPFLEINSRPWLEAAH